MILGYIILFSLLGSVGSIAVAALFLVFPDKTRSSLLPGVLSYATGTLLGTAFLGLIPELLKDVSDRQMSAMVLSGIILFFLLEKLVIWRHCHTEECDIHEASGPLILIGDGVHNFVDGIVIAVAFLSSIPLGVAVSISIITHEIPQEVGDFAILLKNKYSLKKAFGLNIVSGLTALVGSVGAYFFLGALTPMIPLAMGLAAGSFLYIALADLIPGLHRTTLFRHSALQVVLLVAGVSTILLFHLNP
ncbi:MAG: ZIP family metal transporter [Fidelibacterota bacterium]